MDLISSFQSKYLQALFSIKISIAGFEDERIANKLIELLNNTEKDDEHVRRWLAVSLMEIDPRNQDMISAFLDLLQNSESWSTCRWVSANLGELCNENPPVINTLIDLMETTKERRISDNIALGLREIFQLDVLKVVVKKLKDFLDRDTREQNFMLYQNAFEVLWHCAERLPYGEFYKIWHEQPALAESKSE